MTHNQKTFKFMGHIVEGLGAINSAPSAGFAKVTIKARLLDSFVGKETKTKWMWPWLHQIEAYMETQRIKINKEQIHLPKPRWRSTYGNDGCPKRRRCLTSLKPSYGKSLSSGRTRFTPHHFVLQNGMEFLELTQGDDRGSLAVYVQEFNRMLIMVPLNDKYVRKLIFLHVFKPWVWKIIY